jgi:hypothetical protein
MKKLTQQFVVMANGDVRIPEGTSEVGHGHRAPDEKIKIVVPAAKHSVLVEVEVELEEPATPGIATRLPA